MLDSLPVVNIIHVCDECDIQLEEDAEMCSEHPDATITSLVNPNGLTVKMVKELLPNVMVNFEGKNYRAHVYGRMLDFARVQIISKPYIVCEVAWETVTRCFNEGKAIIF